VRVVIDDVSVMATYATIALTTSILVHGYQICNFSQALDLAPWWWFYVNTGCGSLMMVLCQRKHVGAAFIILTIWII